MMTTQEQKVLERMKHVLLHLREGADSYSIGDETGKNIDALLALGALSPEDAAFIRGGFRFYGFNSSQVGKDIPVLETELTTCHLIGTTTGAVTERRK